MFFWPIPVLVITRILSNRWLKAIFCLSSAAGSVIPWFMFTFLATFKSSPLIGFHIARVSVISLAISWLALAVITLTTVKTPPSQSGLRARAEKLLLDALLGGFAAVIVVVIGRAVVMKIPALHAQYVKRANNPEVVLDAFFHALVEDNLAFAKKLATPESQKRLDQWKIESQHTALRCSPSRFMESNSSSSMPIVTYIAANQAISKVMKFECWYGDRASLVLYGATLEYNGREWLVANWKRICVTISKSSPTKCYE